MFGKERTSARFSFAVLICLCTILAAAAKPANAQDCHGGGNYSDLYLSYEDVPEDFYDQIYPGDGDTLFSNETYFDFIIPTISGIKILPPEAIEAGEEYIPRDHYAVDLHPDGTATAYFCRAGIYAVKVLWENPDSSHIYFVFVNAAPLSKKDAKVSPCQHIETPTADVIIVEDPGENNGKEADDYSAAAYNGEVRVSTVQQAIEAINDKHAQLERKVSVIIDGHGAPGDQSVGEGSNGTNNAGETLKDNNDKVQQFCDALKGKISSLKLMGCEVGQGQAGRDLLKTLCEGLKDENGAKPDCRAYDKVVYSQAISIFGLITFGARLGVDKGAQLVTCYIGLGMFDVKVYLSSISIEWSTLVEINNAGFNIYRAMSEDGPYFKINDALIPAKGSSMNGASYSFMDDGVIPGIAYYYWLEDINQRGESMIHGPVSTIAGSTGEPERAPRPVVYSLAQNYPNPFNPATEIYYALPVDCQVNLAIFNVAGQHIKTLVDEFQNAGGQIVIWDGKNESGRDVPSGLYFYKLRAGSYSAVRKMTLIR